MKNTDLKQLVTALITEVMAIKVTRDHPELSDQEKSALTNQLSVDFFETHSEQADAQTVPG
jgi:hypothetical protein